MIAECDVLETDLTAIECKRSGSGLVLSTCQFNLKSRFTIDIL